MKRFIHGSERTQGILLPEQLGNYVTEENPVKVIDVFVNELDLAALGFAGVTLADIGRPAYHRTQAGLSDGFFTSVIIDGINLQNSRIKFRKSHQQKLFSRNDF